MPHRSFTIWSSLRLKLLSLFYYLFTVGYKWKCISLFTICLSKNPTNGQNLLLDIISLPSPHFPLGIIPHRKLGNYQVIVFFLNSVWAESLHFLLYFHVLWIIVMHRNNPKNKYILVFNDMDNLKKGASSRFEKKWTNQTTPTPNSSVSLSVICISTIQERHSSCCSIGQNSSSYKL